MSFAHPDRLWLLLLVPALLAWSVRGIVLRNQRWTALAQRGRPPREGSLIAIATTACLIVALAQPRWGGLFNSKLPPGHDVVLAIDVSRSMAAEDAVPNRLALALESARSLVNALAASPADRAAVVAFAGRAVLVCPLTENLGAVLDSLKRLEPGIVQPGGSDLASALDASLQALDPHQLHAQGRAIVLFTDGEDHTERWRSRLDRLRDEDIAVHAIAIGDTERGHPILTGTDRKPLTYDGAEVLTRRTDSALDELTRENAGALVRLGLTSTDLGSLYRTRIAPSATLRRLGLKLSDRVERFPLFLTAGTLFLVFSSWPTTRRWSFPWIWSRAVPPPAKPHQVLAATSTAVTALLLISAQPSPPPANPPNSATALKNAVAHGLTAYSQARFSDALVEFQTASQLAPGNPVLLYDAAATLFQLGRYSESAELYQQARQSANSTLRVKIDYALGNSALVQSDIQGAISAYDSCLASTATGNALDAIRRDAAINRRFALEQAQSIALAQSGKEPGSGKAPGRNRAPNADDESDGSPPDERPPDSQSADGSGPSDRDSDSPSQKPRSRNRRSGGAGGSGRPSSGDTNSSPEDRLDRALENIQNARGRRLPDSPPVGSEHTNRKDW